MKDLHRRVEILNALYRRRLELEAQSKMVTTTTATSTVRALKAEHARVVHRIALLERKLK